MAQFNLDEYVTVNDRLEKFYEVFPDGSIQTEIISNENGVCIFKAYAYRDQADLRPATGHAYEKEGSSFINKTSHIENCETSAVGRALAMLGFEIKKSIASREEVANAKLQQEQGNKEEQKYVEDIRNSTIDAIKISALTKAVISYNISDEDLLKVLNEYGYYTTNNILEKDYKAICDKLAKLKKEGK
jgi:hypothetical protein